jgi:hypothetical protein
VERDVELAGLGVLKGAPSKANQRPTRDHNRFITSQVIGSETANCVARFMGGKSPEPVNPYLSYAHGKMIRKLNERSLMSFEGYMEAQRKQQELDAPRLKAQLNAAATTYVVCLLNPAEALALAPSEAAEVIVKATFAACRKEREAVPLAEEAKLAWISWPVVNCC